MMPGEGAIEGPNEKLKIDSDCLLLVEGQDEVNLFCAMIQRCLGDDSNIQVIAAGGRDQFRKRLEAIRIEAQTRPPLRSIGVIRDADANPTGAFQSVCDHLCNVGYEPPDAHGSFSNACPSIGVFIIPDGVNPGALETLCRQSVLATDAAQCVEQYLQCLGQSNAMHSTNVDKTFAHAYLAAMHNPVARVGEAAHMNVWDFKSPAFENLSCFVGDLSSQHA